jgi:hypothetical protein
MIKKRRVTDQPGRGLTDEWRTGTDIFADSSEDPQVSGHSSGGKKRL